MADLYFPDIPHTPYYSYEIEPEDIGTRSEVMDGPSIGHATKTISRDTLIWPGWKMSSADMELLLDFYKNKTYGSAKNFKFTNPDPDSSEYGQIKSVYFAAVPHFKKLTAGWWVVDITLKEA